MYLSRKQKDAKRIDDLAQLCRGKVGVAAILAGRYTDVTTLDEAVKAAGDFKTVERVLQQSNALYYKWIARALDDIRRLLSKIDFSLVASAREGSFSTHGIFEEVFTQIIKKIDGQYNILHSVNEAAQQELTHEDAKETVIKLVTQIKEASLEMKGLCRRLLHFWMYPLTDARLIVFLFIVAILPFLLHFMQQTPPLWRLHLVSSVRI